MSLPALRTTLLVLVLHIGGGALRVVPNREDREGGRVSDVDAAVSEQAARLALLAVRAALPYGTEIDGSRLLLPETDRILVSEDAVQYLVGLPKPIACAAEVYNGLVHLRCAQLDRSDEWLHAHALRALESSDGFLGLIKKLDLRGRTDKRVLVLGRNESLVVPFAAVEEWSRNYVTKLPLSLSGRSPDKAERQQQVAHVIVASRHEDALSSNDEKP